MATLAAAGARGQTARRGAGDQEAWEPGMRRLSGATGYCRQHERFTHIFYAFNFCKVRIIYHIFLNNKTVNYYTYNTSVDVILINDFVPSALTFFLNISKRDFETFK